MKAKSIRKASNSFSVAAMTTVAIALAAALPARDVTVSAALVPLFPPHLEGADEQVKTNYLAWAATYGYDDAGEHEAAFLMNVAPEATPVALRIVGIEVVEGGDQGCRHGGRCGGGHGAGQRRHLCRGGRRSWSARAASRLPPVRSSRPSSA